MTIELRDAESKDADHCLDLLSELRASTGAELSQLSSSAFDSLVDQTRGHIVIAEQDGATLGMAAVSYNIALRYGGEYCQLEELIVHPDARGKQVGALLLQRTLENARQRGCVEIGLYLIERTEHNQSYYEKFGFQVVGSEMRQALAST